MSISSRSFFHSLDKKKQGERVYALDTSVVDKIQTEKMRWEQEQTMRGTSEDAIASGRCEWRGFQAICTHKTPKKTARKRDRRQRKNRDNLEETRIVVTDKQIDS